MTSGKRTVPKGSQSYLFSEEQFCKYFFIAFFKLKFNFFFFYNIRSVIGLRFAYALGDDSMINVNFLSLAVNIIYTCFFYIYTPNNTKTAVWGQIGIGGALSVAVLAYSQYEDPKLLEFRLGMLLTFCLFGLVASPYLSLGEIIRNKSTGELPFPIIFSGTIVSALWLLYGIILNNGVMVVSIFFSYKQSFFVIIF